MAPLAHVPDPSAAGLAPVVDQKRSVAVSVISSVSPVLSRVSRYERPAPPGFTDGTSDPAPLFTPPPPVKLISLYDPKASFEPRILTVSSVSRLIEPVLVI